MTVAELIAKLQEMPPDARVVFPRHEQDGFEEICSAKTVTAHRYDEWCRGWWEEAPTTAPGATTAGSANLVGPVHSLPP